MDSNPVVPPSLIGAGVATQPQPPQSLIGALRSQGSMPAEAMQQMTAPPQANLGLGFGSGVLAAAGGQPGANPYLAQQAQQANQAQTQQSHMAALAQKAQQARQAQETKKQEALLKVSQELLKGDSEDGRLVGAKGLQTYGKSVGLEIPDSLVQGMATKRLSPDQYNDIMKRVGMGYDDLTIQTMYPGVKPQDLQQIKKVMKDPVALKAVGLKTPDELKKDAFDLQIKEAQAIESKFPELKGDPKMVHATIMMHRKLNAGQDYIEGTKESQAAAYDAAVRAQEVADEKKLRLKSELDTTKLLAGIDARLAGQQQKARVLTPAQQLQVEKSIAPFKKKADLITMIDKLQELTDQMDKIGALPTGPDVVSQLSAKAKRSILLRGDPSVVTFEQLWGPISIGQIDRGMFDEKGVRAISAFSKQLSAVDNIPPAEAMKAYLKTVRSEIIRTMGQDIQVKEKLGSPPEAIEVMRDLYAPYGGSSAPSPLKPQLPPGTKLEGGKLISESGKFEWNGKAWIPRAQ